MRRSVRFNFAWRRTSRVVTGSPAFHGQFSTTDQPNERTNGETIEQLAFRVLSFVQRRTNQPTVVLLHRPVSAVVCSFRRVIKYVAHESARPYSAVRSNLRNSTREARLFERSSTYLENVHLENNRAGRWRWRRLFERKARRAVSTAYANITF